jgi:hypothetical protein
LVVNTNNRSASGAAPWRPAGRTAPGWCRAEAAVLGDEVDVLEDHDCGLQIPGQLRCRADDVQRTSGEHKPGIAVQTADQVTGRVGLAGAGRPEQQESALEMLAGREQLLAMFGDAQCMPLDAVQHQFGQDDVGPSRPRNVGEGQDHAAHRRRGHLEHMPAIDIQPGAQYIQLGEHRLGLAHG